MFIVEVIDENDLLSPTYYLAIRNGCLLLATDKKDAEQYATELAAKVDICYVPAGNRCTIVSI